MTYDYTGWALLLVEFYPETEFPSSQMKVWFPGEYYQKLKKMDLISKGVMKLTRAERKTSRIISTGILKWEE